jgi:hypothetical protein
MIKSLMEKSDEGIEDEEAKYWASQFDENEYNSDDEQLTDEEMSMIFRDMEQAERELAKGTEHEMEHLETLKKVSEHKITPEEAVVETAQKHIAENKNYYEDLAKMEKENEVSNIDNLMSIMDSKIKYQGYSLKELYDEVISMQGSRDGALIFSEFIKRKKDERDTKIMDEFNKTSFVENINPVKENKEIFTGKMDNGQPFMFFIGKEPKNGYKSENAKEFYNENGYWIDNQLGFNNLLTGYFKDYESMLDHTNPKYHSQLGVENKSENDIKIGTEFYDYYEPIKQRVVSFDSERVFSVPVNIPISEQDDYRLKRIFKIDKFKEILSRQDEFEAEINSSLESKGKLDLKKELETKKELIKKEEKDRISKAFSGSKLQVGKKLATLQKIIKVNGVLFDLKEYIEKLANELSGNEKIEIKNIKNEPHLSINGSSYKPLINETGLEYFKYLLSLKESENEESIPDLIEGLKVLAGSLEGAEKKEIEDVIEGLEILLESDDKYAEGGELDNNSMFFETSKADQDEEKRIMEDQFGKNI